MIIIGLTGPSGSGKGLVSSLLKNYNIPAIDTDAVYHELLSPPSECLEELKKAFGSNIMQNGQLDRPKLASIVFADKSKLGCLNKITHKFILEKTDSILAEYRRAGYRAAIVDAPALYEAEYDKKCDFVIAVIAPKQLRFQRIMKRDNLTEEAANRRINAQHDDEFYSSKAKYTVVNDNNEVALNDSLYRILCLEGLLP